MEHKAVASTQIGATLRSHLLSRHINDPNTTKCIELHHWTYSRLRRTHVSIWAVKGFFNRLIFYLIIGPLSIHPMSTRGVIMHCIYLLYLRLVYGTDGFDFT